MRRERDKSGKQQKKVAGEEPEESTAMPPPPAEEEEEETEESAVVELRDDVDIETDYYKVPNDLYKIAPLQDPKEHCAYAYLYRLSYGWRRNFCRVGYGAVVNNTSLSSKSSAIRAIEGLIEKKHIIRIEEESLKQGGTLYRVLTPEEILSGVFKLSIVKLSIVKLSIPKSTISKLSIVKLNTQYTQNDYTQFEYSQKNGSTQGSATVLNMSIVNLSTNKNNSENNEKTTTEGEPQPDRVKDALVVVSSSRFFKDMPESTVRRLCGKYGAEKVIEKVRSLEEQYGDREMENPGGLLTDALKRDYSPPRRVLRKREAEEKAKEREKEKLVEQELRNQEEEIRRRALAEKAKLKPKERARLRARALQEIKSMEGIKEEFITEYLIEAKENELIGKQLDTRLSE